MMLKMEPEKGNVEGLLSIKKRHTHTHTHKDKHMCEMFIVYA